MSSSKFSWKVVKSCPFFCQKYFVLGIEIPAFSQVSKIKAKPTYSERDQPVMPVKSISYIVIPIFLGRGFCI